TFVLSRWFQRVSHAANVEQRNRIGAVTAQIAESVAGMAIVQAFNRERRFQAEFDALNDANRAQATYVQKIFSVFFPSIEFLGVFAMGSVLYFGSHLYQSGTLTIGTLITAIYLLQLVFQPLQELSDVYGQLQSAGAAMVKIASILDEESEIRERPGAEPLPRLDGDLEIDSVVFAYGKDPVLHGISFHMAPGSCFALVGESGHGKSTLARLIGRHYDPDQGAVRVDGHDLRDVELRSYRRQLGVVLQDPFLFSGTIASNIRFAKPDATDEEVEAAAAAVGVDRVAARLSGGLHHAVREGGSGLSAGERQLISIARALLADPRILILDEATSNIDRPTETLIEHALDRLLKGRTSIIIAHRLSTVRRADEILVVEHGRILQRGTELELLAQDGPFRRLAHDLTGVAGVKSASVHVPEKPTLPRLREASAGCRACPLWETGTQTVFGEGAAHAEVMFVGEQPGDQEDQQGRPFVGPAGRVLDDALAAAGIDRDTTYVTNAVKHFKWQARGKRRIHEKPNWAEMTACRPWLEVELEVVQPT